MASLSLTSMTNPCCVSVFQPSGARTLSFPQMPGTAGMEIKLSLSATSLPRLGMWSARATVGLAMSITVQTVGTHNHFIWWFHFSHLCLCFHSFPSLSHLHFVPLCKLLRFVLIVQMRSQRTPFGTPFVPSTMLLSTLCHLSSFLNSSLNSWIHLLIALFCFRIRLEFSETRQTGLVATLW